MRGLALITLIFSLLSLTGCLAQGLPTTPLLAGLGGETYAQGTRDLQQRLNARFPKGSSPAALARYLEDQGLGIDTGPIVGEWSGRASIRTSGIICGSQVVVSWAVDKAKTIQSLDAMYADTGCP